MKLLRLVITNQTPAIQNIKNFVQPSDAVKSTFRQILDSEACISITSSQKMFMARNCCKWSTDNPMLTL